MTAEIKPLYTKTDAGEEAEAIVAIDASATFEIGEGQRRLAFRTMIDAALPLDQQKKRLRNMLQLGDFEKAHYELIDLECQLPLREKALKNAEEDVARIAKKNQQRREEIEIELSMLKQDALNTHNRQEAEWNQKRQGKFVPSAAQENAIGKIRVDIDKLEKEQKGLDDQDAGERQNVLTALARGRQDLAMCREEIAKRRHILGIAQE